MKHPDPVIETLSGLVSIESVNPSFGGSGEKRIGDFVEQFFTGRDFLVFRDEVHPGRENVIVRVGEGRSDGPVILLEAHLDTVSGKGMAADPFSPVIDDEKLFGRGACDVKAGLAAMMHAVAEAASSDQLRNEVVFAATVDEEDAFTGALGLIDWMEREAIRPAVAVVAEPTEMRIVSANKGVLRFRITTSGRAAHSSRPELGENAIVRMASVIEQLGCLEEIFSNRSHPLVGSSTSCVSMISGGCQINIVPDFCEIAIDHRLLPGEKAQEIWEEYRGCLADFDGVTVLKPDLEDEAMETPATDPAIETARLVQASMNLEAQPLGVPFGCDATKFHRAGIPSFIYGPGSIEHAHAAVEFVELVQVKKAVAFYRDFLLNYPG